MPKCKLYLKDEVNCKFEGLDLLERRKLVEKFKFDIPHARFMPAVRLGRWDGKASFFNLGGSTYTNLLGDILPLLDSYKVELIDYRNPVELNFDKVTAESYNHVAWPEGHTHEGQPIVLRDYQIDVINRFLENPQSIQEVATGAGKTLITAALSNICEKYGRTIVIVPNKSLVTQTEEDYINLGLDVGVFYGDRKEYGRTHTICTWQSLNILTKKTRAAEVDITIEDFIDGVVCVMVDEVHMSKADVLKQLLTQQFAHVPIRWGLTGTIPKEQFEWMSLKVSIGDVVNRIAAADLQDKGVLANCHVNIIQLNDYGEYNNYQSELKYLLNNEDRLDYISGFIDNVKESGNTLILVDRISAGKSLESKIDNSVFVSGSTKADERKEHYDDVKTSDAKIIIATYGVAAVGINIPRIFNLVLLEPGKSFVRVIQSIGRGIRKAEDKDFVQIWDITSTCKYAKRHLTKRKSFYREAEYPFTVEKIKWQG
jgi:superfamily II DNA or RNA helicase